MGWFRICFAGIGLGLWCLASVVALASTIGCSRPTLPPKKEVKTKIVKRTIRIDSTVVEFVDTTACPPGLSDTLYLERRVVKLLPPRDIIVTDTVRDTVKILRTKPGLVSRAVTKNNWLVFALGLILGFYAKSNFWRQNNSG
jgi:hypothetical protein